MPTLNARSSVQLGPYGKGAILTIQSPTSDNIFDFPSLNGLNLGLTFLPKTLTLAADSIYTLTAARVAVTYDVNAK